MSWCFAEMYLELVCFVLILKPALFLIDQAAAIWARESAKKPFWPALVLGILAPDDQKEDWHWALTARNEMRLPEALRTQLTTGKRKAEQALKRQGEGLADPQSFFLVEFLGTHEFIWVRETDIVESFEPDDDPNNKAQAALKKKRPNQSRASSLVGSKKYQAAIEEAGQCIFLADSIRLDMNLHPAHSISICLDRQDGPSRNSSLNYK
jgi:PWWP domain